MTGRATLAQPCAVHRSALAVVTQAPRLSAGAVGRLLHGRTRERVVRRELLFAPGDTVDTLRIAQSLRQVRALGFLDDSVFIETRACAGEPGVALRLVTRDVVSVTPVMKLHGSVATLGLRERNVLGSGVGARMVVRADAGRLGLESAIAAPGLPA